jgi:predicted dehydrogenase
VSNDARLHVAVVGCGKVAQNLHLPALAKSTRCELVAVCDSSSTVAEAVGRRYSVESVYDDIDGVLTDDAVEAVLVAVGDPDHVQVALRAVEAHKHVLVEKPLGTSVAECVPLRDAIRRSGLKLQVGVMKRHDPGVEFARRAILERIGPITSFSVWYRASVDELVDESSLFVPVIRDSGWQRPDYKLDVEHYRLAAHGAHLFDLTRWLVGDISDVRALHARSDDRNDSWHGLLRKREGALGHFELTVYVNSEWSEGLDVFGERGSVSVRSQNPFFLRPSTVRVFDVAAGAEVIEPTFSEGDPYLRQLDAFADSISRGAPVRGDIDDGMAALELIEAVRASAESEGTKVSIDGV